MTTAVLKTFVQNGQFRGWLQSSSGQRSWRSFLSLYAKPCCLTCSLIDREKVVGAGEIDGLIIVPFHKPVTCQVLDNDVEEAFLRHS